MSWDELKLASELREAIDSVGWAQPTQVQSASIPPMLKGQDVALQSRTGSGKTGAFVLPLLQRAVVWQHSMSAKSLAGSINNKNNKAKKGNNTSSGNNADALAASSSSSSSALPPVFLVLVPSVELCAQTISVFEKLGKFVRPRMQLVNLPARQQQHQTNSTNPAFVAAGSASVAPVEAPIGSALALVSTPAFLVKAIKSGILSIELVSQISVLVVDEADMLTSHASMQFLYGLLPPTRQSVVLSATLTESVARLKGALLNQPIAVRVDEEENLLKGDAVLAKIAKQDGTSSQDDAAAANAKKTGKQESDQNEVRVVLPPEDRSKLKQYYLVATDDCNRHTLLYSLFRFQDLLLPGKTLIFVDDEKEPYRLQHFLEQLGIHALVYDMTLPIKARCDILERFQNAEKGVLICTDHTLHMAERLQAELGKQSEKEQGEVDAEEKKKENINDKKENAAAEGEAEDEKESDSDKDEAEDDTPVSADAEADSKKKKETKKQPVQQPKSKTSNNNNKTTNVESGLSRGIDFQNVTNVVLFQGVKAISDEAFTNYLHRIGRTARAGNEGCAISIFSVSEAKQLLGPLRDFLRESRGEQLRPFKKLERSHAAALQYRVQAAVQNVTRHAAKKLRVANVAAEMGRSAYLSTRLNDADNGVLKRLMSGATKKIFGDKNLRNVPEYMNINEADGTSEFESRVAARKLSGGYSRVSLFKHLATGGRRAYQQQQQQQQNQKKGGAPNKNNNNNKDNKNNNDSKRPVSGKKPRSESTDSSKKGNQPRPQNQNRSGSNNNRTSSGVDPLARVAAKLASKRRKLEASD